MKTIRSIAVLVLVIIAVSCKKEKQNDVNIEDKTVSILLSNNNSSSNDSVIDLNSDGTDDFRIYSSLPGGINTNSQIGINSITNFEFSTEISGFINEITKTFSEGSTINASSGTWKADAIFYFYSAPDQFGFNGAGDKYIAFRIKNGTSYNYGWMLVNISGGHFITIKAYGLQKKADVAINAGAK
ncbi:MAG: hypothetical protein U0U67_04200 [Chitinophagales bacterium]